MFLRSFTELRMKSAPAFLRFDSYELRSLKRDCKCRWGGATPILMNFWVGILFLALITVLTSAIVSPTYAIGIFDGIESNLEDQACQGHLP